MTADLVKKLTSPYYDLLALVDTGRSVLLDGSIVVEITAVTGDYHNPMFTVVNYGCTPKTYTVGPDALTIPTTPVAPEVWEFRFEASHCTLLVGGAGATVFEATADAYRKAHGVCPTCAPDVYIHSAKKVTAA